MSARIVFPSCPATEMLCVLQRERATLSRVLGRREIALVIRLSAEQRQKIVYARDERRFNTWAPINLP